MAVPVNTEDQIGKKFDKCLTDGIIKFGGGTLLGAVFSLLFFKRRRWPLLMGGGVGLGMAYNSCETSLNDLFSAPAFRGKDGKISDPATGNFAKDK